MCFIGSIDSARTGLPCTAASGTPAESRPAHEVAVCLSLNSLLLLGECREELDSLQKSLVRQYRPADSVECRLVAEMISLRWRLTRLDRQQATGEAPETLAEQRAGLIWSWHQALVQLRRRRQHRPSDPQPPVESRLAVISQGERETPAGPDRRRPKEPTLPTWLPQAA